MLRRTIIDYHNPELVEPNQLENSEKFDIFKAIYVGNYEQIREKVDSNKLYIAHVNEKNQSPLLYALLYRQVEIAKFLIESGAKIDNQIDALCNKYDISTIQPDDTQKSDFLLSDGFIHDPADDYLRIENIIGEESTSSICCTII